MYCKNCGKELSDEAIMCPDCGTPTGTKPKTHKSTETDTTVPFGLISLILACFAFVTGIIFGSFFCVYSAAVIFLFMIGSTTFLPGLTAICLGIIALVRKNDSHDRIMAIIAIALAGVALLLLFLFLVLCISMDTLLVF